MKIAHEGRRETFPLGTPNKAAAAARARDIYLSLVVNGWAATLASFKNTLRKEYGSLLTRKYGIHDASRALRHADLRTTSDHYSDSTARVTPGVGRLLVD